MLEFFQTVAGRKFFDVTLPRIAEGLKDLSKSLAASLSTPRTPHRAQLAATLLAGSGMEQAADLKSAARDALALADEILKQSITNEG